MSDQPEINLARRLIDRAQLQPPIDVLAIARRFSTVEQLHLPVDVDGVCLSLKRPGKKPNIIVNINGRTIERIRFTVAHELGHVLIPWHTGSIVDEIDITHEETSEYWQLEGEANRFASELLMPSKWIKKKIRKFPLPLDATDDIAASAKVSFLAATIKVLGSLNPGYVFARIQSGVVASSGRSPRTLASQPAIGKAIKPELLFPWTPHRWKRDIGRSIYYWWQFKGDVALPEATTDQDWRELLNLIIKDIRVSPGDIPKFKATINGIIAHANGATREDRTTAKVFEACLERVHSNASRNRFIRRLLEHEKFQDFLYARVVDFFKQV